MAIPSSGEIKLRADIALAVDGVATGTNVSLRALSATAGFSQPDSMSEFYGYSSGTAPVVGNQITHPATNITTTSATLNGYVFFGAPQNGGSPITEVGFYFGTSSNHAANTKYSVPFNSSSPSINYNVTGLSASTTYYCRLYAKNAIGETLAQHSESFATSFQVQTVNFNALPATDPYNSNLFYWYCTNRNNYENNPLSIGYIDPGTGGLMNIQTVNAYAYETGQVWRFSNDYPLYVEAILPVNAKGVFYTDPWSGTAGYGGADAKIAMDFGSAWQFDTTQTESINCNASGGVQTNITQFINWQNWDTTNRGTTQMRWEWI